MKNNFLKISSFKKECTERSGSPVLDLEGNNEVITILQKTIDILQSQL